MRSVEIDEIVDGHRLTRAWGYHLAILRVDQKSASGVWNIYRGSIG